MTDPAELTGIARRNYELWRSFGLSESAAVDALRADELIPVDPFEAEVQQWQRTWGLTRAGAVRATVGRYGSAREARRAAVVAEGQWAASRENHRDRLEALRVDIEETRRLLDLLGDEDLAELAERLVVREAPRTPAKAPAARSTARPGEAPTVVSIREQVRRMR